MTFGEARELLAQNNFDIANEDRLPNGHGTQIRLTNGSIVNVFDNGKVNVQGVDNEEVKALFRAALAQGATPVARGVAAGMANDMRGLAVLFARRGATPAARGATPAARGATPAARGATPAARGATPVAAPTASKRKVFVVYGHDPTARDQLEVTLRRWGLEPLILDQLPTDGQTVIEKLESTMEEVGFAIVLATPDDEGYRVGHPEEKAYRARQNVVLEMGMLLAKLGRENVAILLKTQEEQEDMERPSDINGLIYIQFRDDIANDAGLLLAKAMDARGYAIDIAKL